MLVEKSPSEVQKLVRQQQAAGSVVGVVPTMGALHQGHLSLVEAARRECDFVITTIFVNPTQFGPNEDFERYPRTLQQDLNLCEQAGTDLVFTPETSTMYPDQAATEVRVRGLTETLEGQIRPGHFDGVTTIVAKLFNVTTPDLAYFGQKDYQQQLILRRMATDLNWNLKIVTCPIVRESDGLAMSSRNRYLSTDDRQRALVLHESLELAVSLAANSDDSPLRIAEQMQELISSRQGVSLDYAVIVDCDSLQPLTERQPSAVALVAARLGSTRLIDNQILQFR
jgi:pantoate--beta-alanine ligase